MNTKTPAQTEISLDAAKPAQALAVPRVSTRLFQSKVKAGWVFTIHNHPTR